MFKTNKHISTNKATVPNLPFLETFILDPVNKTYIEPIRTKNSLTKTEYIKISGIKCDNHINKIINTILSVKGSRIIPNLETKLYLLATIPSRESEIPIAAINKIKIYGVKSSTVKLKNKYKDRKNLVNVIKLGSKKTSANFKEVLRFYE